MLGVFDLRDTSIRTRSRFDDVPLNMQDFFLSCNDWRTHMHRKNMRSEKMSASVAKRSARHAQSHTVRRSGNVAGLPSASPAEAISAAEAGACCKIMWAKHRAQNGTRGPRGFWMRCSKGSLQPPQDHGRLGIKRLACLRVRPSSPLQRLQIRQLGCDEDWGWLLNQLSKGCSQPVLSACSPGWFSQADRPASSPGLPALPPSIDSFGLCNSSSRPLLPARSYLGLITV